MVITESLFPKEMRNATGRETNLGNGYTVDVEKILKAVIFEHAEVVNRERRLNITSNTGAVTTTGIKSSDVALDTISNTNFHSNPWSKIMSSAANLKIPVGTFPRTTSDYVEGAGIEKQYDLGLMRKWSSEFRRRGRAM